MQCAVSHKKNSFQLGSFQLSAGEDQINLAEWIGRGKESEES